MKCIMFGSLSTLSSSNIVSHLLKLLEKNKWIFTLNENDIATKFDENSSPIKDCSQVATTNNAKVIIRKNQRFFNSDNLCEKAILPQLEF